MAAAQIWAYEVREMNGRYQAKQLLNGTLLKCCWYDTEEHAKGACRTWRAAAEK